jgi:hypothetical protein
MPKPCQTAITLDALRSRRDPVDERTLRALTGLTEPQLHRALQVLRRTRFAVDERRWKARPS